MGLLIGSAVILVLAGLLFGFTQVTPKPMALADSGGTPRAVEMTVEGDRRPVSGQAMAAVVRPPMALPASLTGNPFAGDAPSAAAWPRLSEELSGLSVAYPPEWSVLRDEAGQISIGLAADGVACHVALRGDQGTGDLDQRALDATYNQGDMALVGPVIRVHAQARGDAEPILHQAGITEIAGGPANHARYSIAAGPESGLPQVTARASIRWLPGRTLALWCVAPATRYETLAPAFDRVRRSLRLVERG